MNPYPPISPQDEKIYNICLKDGSIIINVEYWDFGGGFIMKQRGVLPPNGYGDKYVDFKMEEITGFELVFKEHNCDNLMYNIVKNYTPEGLEAIVNSLLKDGWKCQGGVYVIRNGNGNGIYENVFFQAMVKQTETTL